MTEGEIRLAFFGLSIVIAFLSMRVILDLEERKDTRSESKSRLK